MFVMKLCGNLYVGELNCFASHILGPEDLWLAIEIRDLQLFAFSHPRQRHYMASCPRAAQTQAARL